MRLGESLAFITDKKHLVNSIHGPLVQYVKYVFAALGKMYTDKISRDEFINWAKYDLFDSSICLFDEIFAHITTLRPEYDRVINYGPMVDSAAAAAAAASASSSASSSLAGRRLSEDRRPSLNGEVLQEENNGASSASDSNSSNTNS